MLYLLFAALVAFAIQTISANEVNVCELPIASGGPDVWCKAYFPRWGYDKETDKCKKFIYGGCKGNENRFLTEAECQFKCGRSLSPRHDWNPQHPFDIPPEGSLYKRSPGLDWDWDPLNPFDTRPPGSKPWDWNNPRPFNFPRQDWDPQHPFDIPPEGRLYKRSPGLDWDWDPLNPFDTRPPGSKPWDWNNPRPFNFPRQDWDPQHPFDIPPEGRLYKRSPGLDWNWDPLNPFDTRPPGSKPSDWNNPRPFNFPRQDWDPQHPFDIPPEGRLYKRSPGLDWNWDPLNPFDTRPPGSKPEDWNNPRPFNFPRQDWDPQHPFDIPPEGRLFKRSPGLDWDWDPLNPFDTRPPGSKPEDWNKWHSFPQVGLSQFFNRQDWNPQRPFDIPPQGRLFKRSTRQKVIVK